jgi:serine protease AprX
VRSRLTSTAVDRGAAGKDNQFGWGRVDAENAIFAYSAVLSGPTKITVPGNKSWSASVSPVGGGTGSYAYQWEESYNQGSTWIMKSTSQTYSTYVDATDPPTWLLRLTITSGPYVQTRTVLILNNTVF